MAEEEHLSTIIGDNLNSGAGMKRRIEYLESGLDALKLALEQLKRSNEVEEDDPDVEQSPDSAATIQPLEQGTDDESSSVDTEVVALKIKENSLRAEFVRKIAELDQKTRLADISSEKQTEDEQKKENFLQKLTQNLQDLKKQNDLLKKLQDLKKYNDLLDKLKDSKKHTHSLEKKLQDLKKYNDLLDKLKDSKKHTHSLEKKLQEHCDENHKLVVSKKQIEEQLQEVAQYLQDSKRDIDVLENKLKKMVEDKDDMDTDRERLKTKLQEIERAKDDFLEELTQNRQESEEKTNMLERNLKLKDKKLQEVCDENIRLVESKKYREEQLMIDVQEKDRKVQELRNMVESNKKVEEQLMIDVQEKDRKVQELLEQNTKLKKSSMDKETCLGTLQNIVQQKDEELMKLKERKENEIEMVEKEPMTRLERRMEVTPHNENKMREGLRTREGLGNFMGSLVALTSFLVSHANKDMKIMFFSGLVTLLGILLGTVFNDIVTIIFTDKEASTDKKGKSSKTLRSLFWILMGAILPLLVGGFIQTWWKRCLATSIVVFFEKVTVVYIWSNSYKIPKREASIVVCLGVVGIGLAAGLPQLLKLLVG
ncbi:hypothetical protein AALP_AA3G359000 [Arabis alpina]|uniref:Uncharacterized protein n=1 Tax=Arabis alpina TaxID=50452 RepID=A0A087HDW4_ARAAL|nr:hypothetical protein AALP_AA3G359000 [Arabis alpina]